MKGSTKYAEITRKEVLKTAEKDFYRTRIIMLLQSDMQQTWKIIKCIIGLKANINECTEFINDGATVNVIMMLR